MVVRLNDIKKGTTSPSAGGGVRLSDLKKTTSTPSHKPINGLVEQDDIMGSLDKSARLENEYAAKKQATREIPVIGKALKGLDAAGEFIESNPITHFITQTGRDLASMGPVGTTQALYGQAENIIGRYAPKLLTGTKIGQKVLGEATKEAIVGAPLGAAQTLAADPNSSIGDITKGAVIGGIGGAALGGAVKGATQGLVRLADIQAGKIAQNAVRNAAELPSRTVESPFTRGAVDNPVSAGYTENVGNTFGNKSVVRLSDLKRTEVPTAASADNVVVPDVPPAQPGVPVTPEQPQIPVNPSENVVRPRIDTLPNERGLVTRLRESEKLTPGVQNSLEASPSRVYEPIGNVDTVNAAKERIGRGVDQAESYVFENPKNIDADQVATGFLLMNHFQASGHIERAVTVAERLAEALTKSGQAIQAASIWNRLTPEGALIAAQRTAKKAGKELDVVDAGKITNFAQQVQKSGQSVERSGKVMDIAEKINKGEELSVEEISDLRKFFDDSKSFLKETKAVKEKPVKLPSEKKVREQLLESLTAKEEELLKFIQANSRRFNSTPLDLWGAYAALGAVKLAKGAISFSKWSEEMIKAIGPDIKPHLNNLYDQAQQQVENLDRLLPAKGAPERVADTYTSANRLSPSDAYKIHELASRIGKLSQKDKQQAARDMQEILTKYSKSTIEDKINAVRYMAMLGNTTTQLTNIISSPIKYLERQLLDLIQTPFDIARSKLTGADRQVTFKQGPSVWDSFFEPAKDYGKGAKIGAESGWKGIDPDGITSQTEQKGLAFKSKFNPMRYLEGSLGAVMKGADYGAYNAAVNNKLRKMAYLDALNKGIKGKEEIRRYMDKYLNNMDSNIMELASKEGKSQTFQGENQATKGGRYAVQGFNLLSTLGASKKLGLGSALLPFVKTPVNILMDGLAHTPAGLLKGLYELSTVRKNPNLSAAQVSDTFAKAILGTVGLSGTGYVLGKLGIITGSSPNPSKSTQALEEEVGQGKFKFNTTAFSRMMEALVSKDVSEIKKASKYQEGDKLLNYTRLQPLAFPVSIGATAATQQGRDVPTSEKALEIASSGVQSLYDMSFLRGIKDAFDIQPTTEQGNSAVDLGKRIGQTYAKSFSPSLPSQEARREDEFQRQPTNKGLTAPVTEYFKSRTPSLGGLIPEKYTSKSLPKKVTATGIEKKNERGLIATYLNPNQSTTPQYNEASQIIYDLIQRTGDQKLAPELIDKSVRGKDKKGNEITIQLDPKRAAALQKQVGDRITREVLKLPKLSDARLALKIEDIYTMSRSIAREQAKKELGMKYDRTIVNKK